MKRSLYLTLAALVAVGFIASAVYAQQREGAKGPGAGKKSEVKRADRPDADHVPARIRQAEGRAGQGQGRGQQGIRGPQAPGIGPGPGAGIGPGQGVGPQERFGPPELRPFWRAEKVRENLKLTDDQVKTLDAANTEARDKLVDLEAKLTHKRNALQDALAEDNPGKEKVFKAIDELSAVEAEIKKVTIGQRLFVQSTLTPEQREKARDLMRDRAQAAFDERPRQGGRFEWGPGDPLGDTIRERVIDRLRQRDRVEKDLAPPEPEED